MQKNLENKPLVEAVFELKWRNIAKENSMDIGYNFFVGKFYEKVKYNFPISLALPSSQIPSEQIPFVPQYQFKKDDNSPIIQLGNGILTVNELQSYSWDNHFEKYCQETVADFVAISNNDNFAVEELKLRYINAIEVDFNTINSLDYLKEYLSFELKLPAFLFQDGNIGNSPYNFLLNILLPVQVPQGAIGCVFRRGQKNGKDALIWELSFVSVAKDVVNLQTEFGSWLSKSHKVIEDCFFSLINNKLLTQFKNV